MNQHDIDAIKECIQTCSEAYSMLEQAKEECAGMVEAAMELFISKTTLMVKPSDKRSIKKVARAMALGRMDELKAEVAGFVDILQMSGICDHNQLTLFGLLNCYAEDVEATYQ